MKGVASDFGRARGRLFQACSGPLHCNGHGNALGLPAVAAAHVPCSEVLEGWEFLVLASPVKRWGQDLQMDA